MEPKESEHGGVQGTLTLSYDSRENTNEKKETTYATQLKAEDDKTVVLLEFSQDKGIMDNTQENRASSSYRIDAGKLAALIKEHGEKIK